jgi:hypothetical protein
VTRFLILLYLRLATDTHGLAISVCIQAETTDVFYLHKGQPGMLYADVNYEILLRGCNSKLTSWSNTWQQELVKGNVVTLFNPIEPCGVSLWYCRRTHSGWAKFPSVNALVLQVARAVVPE